MFSKNLMALLLLVSGLTGCTLFTNVLKEVETTPNPPQQPSKISTSRQVQEEPSENNDQASEELLTEEKHEESEIPEANQEEIIEEEEEADIYVSPWGTDVIAKNLDEKNQRLTVEKEVLYVSEKGIDRAKQSLESKEGSKTSPFRSLTFAIKQAQRIRQVTPDNLISIQMEAGTYSTSSGESSTISIPPGLSIKGRGDKTIIMSSFEITQNAELSNLQIKNNRNGIDVRGTNIKDKSVILNQLTLTGCSIYIDGTSPFLSNININEGKKYYSGSGIISLKNSNAKIENLKVNNSIILSEDWGFYINGYSAPTISNIELINTYIGIMNEGNISIKNLNITNSVYGITNGGEMTIDKLTLKGNKYTGICNWKSGTILINGLNVGHQEVKTLKQCPNTDESPPLVIPDIAGNIAGVTY